MSFSSFTFYNVAMLLLLLLLLWLLLLLLSCCRRRRRRRHAIMSYSSVVVAFDLYFFDATFLWTKREKELAFASLFYLSTNHSARFCFINWSRRVYKTKRSTVIGLISSEYIPTNGEQTMHLSLSLSLSLSLFLCVRVGTNVSAQDDAQQSVRKRKDSSLCIVYVVL